MRGKEIEMTKRGIRRLVIATLLAVSFVVGAGSAADARMCARVRMLEPFPDVTICSS
jgi:hypothetical protein